ncbi:hypothetical protein L2E82_46946 [Cichorium intybus]|uniref:Uncharacterized protein n=1 Tax=Cichorium intybus TaxID=13427 RepID=A0ACB8YV57_CICIN|nr:hypothetical protein L2E82_46946 [Cichorium intybus]
MPSANTRTGLFVGGLSIQIIFYLQIQVAHLQFVCDLRHIENLDSLLNDSLTACLNSFMDIESGGFAKENEFSRILKTEHSIFKNPSDGGFGVGTSGGGAPSCRIPVSDKVVKYGGNRHSNVWK